MRVGQRLFLAVVPAIFGLLTVTALAYFGKYAREAPEWLVVTAVVASLGSAILAWRNTRYVAQRVEQLAARRGGANGGASRADASAPLRRASALLGLTDTPSGANETVDELDRIEHLVDRLSDALAESRATQAAQVVALAARQQEYETLVRDTVEHSVRQLDEVRLPLHILLDNHFGELNENQEEMLGAARSATELVDVALLRLRDVVRLDLGEVRMRRDRVRLSDILDGITPSLLLAAGDRSITVLQDIAPALPPVLGDRVRLQESLSTLLHDALRRTPDGGELRLSVDVGATGLRLRVGGATGEPTPSELAIAQRLVRASGGDVAAADGDVTVTIPAATTG